MEQLLSFEDAERLFTYDPDTGVIAWRCDNRRVKAGVAAGTLTNDGYLSITVHGKKIRGQYIAWLLAYGTWPPFKLRLKSAVGIDPTNDRELAARQDLRIDNIVAADELVSMKPETVRQRHYNRERARLNRQYAIKLAQQNPSAYPNVVYHVETQTWLVFSIESRKETASALAGTRKPHQVATFKDRFAAESLAAEMHFNREALLDPDTLDDVPVPILPPDLAAATAGPHGPSLSAIYTRLAYDSERGVLFWRSGRNRYQNAATPTTGRTSTVTINDRRLPAHSLAFFIARGVWPARGSIFPFDNDWRNFKLNNLIYAHDHVENYRMEPK